MISVSKLISVACAIFCTFAAQATVLYQLDYEPNKFGITKHDTCNFGNFKMTDGQGGVYGVPRVTCHKKNGDTIIWDNVEQVPFSREIKRSPRLLGSITDGNDKYAILAGI